MLMKNIKLTQEQLVYCFDMRRRKIGWIEIDKYFGFPKSLKGQGAWPQFHKFVFPKQEL